MNACKCGGVMREVKALGRGMRRLECPRCHRQTLPTSTAQRRHSARLQRQARRVLEGPYVPLVPAVRSRTGWTPNEAIPRGERD